MDYRIEILEGVAAIRKRPGMYIGSTGSRGLHHLIEELLFFSLSRKSENIEIILGDNNTIYFRDRDYAIPLDIDRDTNKSFLEAILTTFSDCSIVNSYTYGMIIVSALADLLEVSICQDNKIYSQIYQRGKATTKIKARKSQPCQRITTKYDPCITNVVGTFESEKISRLKIPSPVNYCRVYC